MPYPAATSRMSAKTPIVTAPHLCCFAAVATAELLECAGWDGALPGNGVALIWREFEIAGVAPELAEGTNSAAGGARRPDSVSRLRRCRSERKSAACW